MTGGEFAALLDDFTHSAESGDGARFAGHFTEDGIYYDYIYGAHRGRADIGMHASQRSRNSFSQARSVTSCTARSAK